MIALGHNALAQHHLGPTVLPKNIALGLENSPGFPEQFESMFQGVGDVEMGHGGPERCLLMLIGVIVQYDKVADKGDFFAHLAIEFSDVRVTTAMMRKHLHQADNGSHDQMDTGGFHWLYETRRQPDGNAVFIPMVLSLTRFKPNHSRIGQYFSFRIAG